MTPEMWAAFGAVLVALITSVVGYIATGKRTKDDIERAATDLGQTTAQKIHDAESGIREYLTRRLDAKDAELKAAFASNEECQDELRAAHKRCDDELVIERAARLVLHRKCNQLEVALDDLRTLFAKYRVANERLPPIAPPGQET